MFIYCKTNLVSQRSWLKKHDTNNIKTKNKEFEIIKVDSSL